jgi:SAM-dependent methyltransferase
MHDTAYREYAEESADWLKKGRANLLRHLVEAHRPHGGRLSILEIGAGVGQNLPVLAEFGDVDAAEINAEGRSEIAAQGVARRVFADPIPFEVDGSYDVVCAMDVIEHLEDDRGALRWIAGLLQPGGVLVATVPAYQWLFSDHDRALQHYRRYSRTSFCGALPDALHVEVAAYFNHLLFPVAVAARGAWSLKRMLSSGRAGTKQRSPRSGPIAALLGGALAAELSLIERGYRPPFGLSFFCVARRRA